MRLTGDLMLICVCEAKLFLGATPDLQFFFASDDF